MRIRSSLQHGGQLLVIAGALHLGSADRAKYLLAYYLGRSTALRALAPHRLVIALPDYACVTPSLRPNGADWKTLRDVFVRRLYELHMTSVRRVLDLGANIGLATLFFASEFREAEFACVEPFPDNCDVLREVITRNRVRATVIEAAVGIEGGSGELHLEPDISALSLVPANACERTLRVPLITVPDILARLGWKEIDLLKIDIEGYEKTLFRSNNEWLRSVRLIVGEAHGHADYGIEEVRADLEPWGFRVTLKSYDPLPGLTLFEAKREGSPVTYR